MGSTDTKRKLHNVNWNQVCKPLSQGGLGIPKVKHRILSLIMRLAWRYHISNKDHLWANFLRQKYTHKF